MNTPKRTEEGWQQLVQHTLEMGKKINRMQKQVNLMFAHIRELENRLILNGLEVPSRKFMNDVNRHFPLEK